MPLRYPKTAHRVNLVLIVCVALFGLVIGPKFGFDDSRPVSEQTRDMLWFALLCGLAAFAVIEVLKRVFALRGLYQLEVTRNWLGDHGEPHATDPRAGATWELLGAMRWRTQKRDVRRVFNLPTEQLTAQISAAVDRALLEPSRYPALFTALAGAPITDTRDENDEGRAEYLRAQSVRAGVDQLQIVLGESWRRNLQGAALWIAGAFGLLFGSASAVDDGAEARYVLAAILLGGSIAWIVRDIVAVVERARR